MSQGQLDEQLRSIGLSAAECGGFKELMNGAVFHRREHWEKKTVADQEAWILEMADLVHECGLQRVYLGMRKAWTWNRYLASASEVRECLPPVPDVAKPRLMFDPNCADCSGSGWKTVPGCKDGRVMRCDCNSRPHQARKAADEADANWIKQKVAELDARFRMPAARTRYAAKPPAAVTSPAIQFTAEEIERRKPAERAEISLVEEETRARIDGCYEKKQA